MKTKIILHGKLARIYGKEFEFANVRKPMDVVDAMCTRFPNFKKYLKEQAKEGFHYEFLVSGENKNALELHQKQEMKIVEMAPCIIGKGPFLIVLGFVAVQYGIGLLATSFVAGVFFITLGVGLIIAGIIYLMTDIPENEPRSRDIESSVSNASFMFSNPQNIAAQGRTIPIVYGRLKVGTYLVGTSITTYDLSTDAIQNRQYENTKANTFLKIQECFGSSIKNSFIGY
jgi:predicted phage tail protein